MRVILGIFILCLLMPLSLLAKPILTVVCEPPKGPRIDYGSEAFTESPFKLEKTEDSFTGVNPTFIFDDQDSSNAIMLWGTTRGLEETKAQQVPIIMRTKDQISLIEVDGNGVWVHSLYPQLGFGIFTRQGHWTGTNHAKGMIFYAKCNFAVGAR